MNMFNGGRMDVKSLLLIIKDNRVKSELQEWIASIAKGKNENEIMINFLYLADSINTKDDSWWDICSKLDESENEFFIGAKEYYVRSNDTAISFKDENTDELLMIWI